MIFEKRNTNVTYNYLRLALCIISFFLLSNNTHAEVAIGDTGAPVTIIEYASLSCDYCVKFHREVLPLIKSKYISKGNVRFIYRHYPTSKASLRGAVAAQCAGREHYYNLLNILFATVEDWSRSKNIDMALTEAAASIGLNNKSFSDCLYDPDQEEIVNSMREDATFNYDVTGTPTFLINEKLVRGIKDYDEMEILIQDALKNAK